MSKLKISILAILIILTGALLHYYECYKDIGLLKIVSFIFVFSGSTIIYITFFGHIVFGDKIKEKKNQKVSKWKVNLLRLFSNIVYGAIVVGQMILISNLTDKRVAYILKTQKTQEAVATITKMDNIYSKGGSKHYAIINYQTKDKTVEQAIYDYQRKYLIGQAIRIKYSIEFPEMFEVVETINGQ